MESPLYDSYYPTDPQKFLMITRQYQHYISPQPQPVFTNNEWNHYPQQHHSFLPSPSDTPRIKQEEFPTYPQPRNYDHQITGIFISQPTYYPSQFTQQDQHRQFTQQHQHQQQPAYHPQSYSGGTVHAAEAQTTHSVYTECDPHFVSAASTSQQDIHSSMKSLPLEGWHDSDSPSLSNLTDSEFDMAMGMDGLTTMEIGVTDIVEDEDTIGDEDAEGEDEWDEIPQQPHNPDSDDGHVHVDDVYYERHPLTYNRRRLNSSTSSLPIPIPVPNLTKKSRGRRVPTISSLEDIRSASSGAGRKRQGGKGARMYLCEVEGCGKCFARGEHLKRHVRSIHTYEKPHRCPSVGCGKDFSRHDNLVQHLRVHKGYVPPHSSSPSSTSSPPLSTSVKPRRGMH